ncbi:MAG: hypothetical protein JW821_12660, partial [Deltaproteobacteria bacterium]|nr:hypothetical protein [Deltaproteobacteria bacterium]
KMPDKEAIDRGLRLAANLLKAHGYSRELVDFHVHVPPFSPEVTDRPLASPVARLQAGMGGGVTSMRHERVTLDPFQRRLLSLLDGTRSRAILLKEIGKRGDEGRTVEQEAKDGLGGALDRSLRMFAREALLVG